MTRPAAIGYVIAAWNADGTLPETIASVEAQTFDDWRAVIVDDGSDDATGAVASNAAARDARFTVRRLDRNGGLAAARNAGLAALDAELACFLDADDVIDAAHAAEFVAAVRRTAAEGRPADAVACAYRYLGPELDDLGWTVPVTGRDLDPEQFREFNPLACGCFALRRLHLAQLGPDPFDPSLTVHEDWDLLARLSSAGLAWAPPVQAALLGYRIRPGTMSTDLARMWEVGRVVIDRACHGAGSASLASSRRRWDLRCLARAIAAEDAPLAGRLLAELGGIAAGDMGTLAGSLRWACARHDLAGPAAWPGLATAWRRRAERLLAHEPLVAEILGRFSVLAIDWDATISRARGRVSPGGRLVIYGLGRNGRDCLAAARRIGAEVFGADDHPAALAPCDRIRPEAIERRDSVIITPDDRTDLLDRLRRRGVPITLPIAPQA